MTLPRLFVLLPFAAAAAVLVGTLTMLDWLLDDYVAGSS